MKTVCLSKWVRLSKGLLEMARGISFTADFHWNLIMQDIDYTEIK